VIWAQALGLNFESQSGISINHWNVFSLFYIVDDEHHLDRQAFHLRAVVAMEHATSVDPQFPSDWRC